MTRAVLLDIEGTVGDIAFVREVLFPYARARIADVLKARWDDPEVAATTAGLATPAEAARQFLRWMDEDKKVAPLKTLQGIIWREGYASGELKAHLYADAVDAMRAWHAGGVKLFIYSSGSVEAQKLYFAHSLAGDLTPLIGGYFDTTTGAKGEPASYLKIAAAIGFAPDAITFFSDAKAETDAALSAGLNVFRVDRTKPGAFEGRDGGTPVIGSMAIVAARDPARL
ncbi:MAG: acireductone synthase [Micropepsaceae bacterium]